MYFHRQELQHKASPDKPDAVYARKLQEVLGGQYGEITVALQYQFQAWNMHIPGKYRDLVFGIGAEEMGHVEMLAVMIAQLLEKSPLGITDEAVQSDPTVAAIIGGTDVQQGIVSGAGARPVDSNGNPWQGSFITSSGNLLADFQANANAEMQGRVQVARLYHMTDDHGVRDLLGFLLARDTMHQNQWLAAAAEPGRGRRIASGSEQLPDQQGGARRVVPVHQLLRRSGRERGQLGIGTDSRWTRRVQLPRGPGGRSADAAAHAPGRALLRHDRRAEPGREDRRPGSGCPEEGVTAPSSG